MGGTEGIWRTWGRWGVVALGGTARTRWHLRGHSGDMVGWWHSGGVWGRSEDVGTLWGSSTCGAWWHRGALALMGHKVGGRHQLRPRSPASAAPPMGGQSGGRRCQWAPPHTPLCPPPHCAPHPSVPPTPLTCVMLTPVSASTAPGSFVTTSRISAGSRPTPTSPEPPDTTVTRRVPSSGCATASATWPQKQCF